MNKRTVDVMRVRAFTGEELGLFAQGIAPDKAQSQTDKMNANAARLHWPDRYILTNYKEEN